MLVDYVIQESSMSLLQRGVVVQWMFQLFDLERSDDWEEYPDFENIDLGETVVYRGSYGVCDNLQNLLQVYPELEFEGEGCRKFVVNMAPINKNDQPEWGGWRWHKWGEYIGTQEPTCEYIYDEPVIEQVYCYHIYEKVN